MYVVRRITFWFISTTHKFILHKYTVRFKEFPEVHRRMENRYIAYRCYREGVNFNIQHLDFVSI